MKPRALHSLKWRLIIRIALLQGVMLTLIILLIFFALLLTGLIPHKYEGGTTDVLVEAVARDSSGALVLNETADLASLRRNVPDLWFLIRDREGARIQEGTIPAEFRPFADMADHISDARFDHADNADAAPPAVRVRWIDTDAGKVQIMTGTKGELSLMRLTLQAPQFFLEFILPAAGLMALSTFFATPWVVRGAMSGLRHAAAEAARIDIDRRGMRLPLAGVPIEVVPLVEAVNEALERLDRGYQRHQRFLADAAHELRTPIAILNTRLASLPVSPERARLLQDAARLSTLTNQLLDLQRLGRQPVSFDRLDLVKLAESVVVDLAAMAFEAGYEMTFEALVRPVMVAGDGIAIQRAITNLVQNAIKHGGNAGTIEIAVSPGRVISVSDQGKGIPEDEREKIFEPFYRLRGRGEGAGLGLNLVAEIMRLHQGQIELANVQPHGARFSLTFPVDR
jgi:signal transduction histidine kinase